MKNMWVGVVAVVLGSSLWMASCTPSVIQQDGNLNEALLDGGNNKESDLLDSNAAEGTSQNQEPASPDQALADGGQEPAAPDTTTQPEASLQDGAVSPDSSAIPLPPIDPSLLNPRTPTNHSLDTLHFSGSQNCVMCHNGLKDSKNQDVSIVTAWSSTMMANSSRDPLWQAKFKSELSRLPALGKVIADKCTRCHAPMANHEGKLEKRDIHVNAGGLLDPNSPLFHRAMEGVSCTVCHQIQNTPTFGTAAAMSGKFTLPTYTSKSERVLFGPYDNLFSNPMVMHVSYKPQYSSHIQSSKLCASCHNLKTPFVDAKGNVIPKTPEQEFPEQMIYSEWEHSSYSKGTMGQSCQGCHMKRAQGVKISNRPPWLTARQNFGQHMFVGANVFMLSMLGQNRQLLGITANNFATTIQEAKTMLRSSATLRWTEKRFQNGELLLKLAINNQSGHKLPTGFPSRRVYVHLKVTNAQGAVVFESGKTEAFGRIVGVDADEDAKRYEAHHEEITSPQQVQVYEAVMNNTDKAVTYTLLRASGYLKDNRLLPAGFKKATAPKDIQVWGKAAQDTNFDQGQDVVTYRIANLPAGTYQVSAELNYQTLGYRFAQDLFRDNQKDEVKLFQYLWSKAPSYHETIASLTATVQP